MVSWDVSADRLPRLLALLAGISGCPFDDWDRDAVRYGLPDTHAAAGVWYDYELLGPTPLSLRLAHTSAARIAVEATAAAETEARLARIEVTSDSDHPIPRRHIFPVPPLGHFVLEAKGATVTWEIGADRLPRLLEILAGISCCLFDEWDRDAILYGLPGTDAAAEVWYEYELVGSTPVALRLAHAARGRICVTASVEVAAEARLSRVEVTSDAESWEQLRHAFRRAARPERFVHHPGCPECEGHDRLLRARDRDTLTHYDVRHTWSPVGFLQPDGFRYWLPAFLRLSLSDDEYDFRSELFRYLDEPLSPPFSRLTAEERQATARFLQHLAAWHPEAVDNGDAGRRFERLLRAWEASTAAAGRVGAQALR